MAITKVSDFQSSRRQGSSVPGQQSSSLTVQVDSVIAVATLMAANQLVTTARGAAQALTIEMHQQGLVNASILFMSASLLTSGQTQAPISSTLVQGLTQTPPPASLAAPFGGLGDTGIGLLVGIGGLGLVVAAIAAFVCLRSTDQKKILPNEHEREIPMQATLVIKYPEPVRNPSTPGATYLDARRELNTVSLSTAAPLVAWSESNQVSGNEDHHLFVMPQAIA